MKLQTEYSGIEIQEPVLSKNNNFCGKDFIAKIGVGSVNGKCTKPKGHRSLCGFISK